MSKIPKKTPRPAWTNTGVLRFGTSHLRETSTPSARTLILVPTLIKGMTTD